VSGFITFPCRHPTLPHAGGLAADVDVFKADDGDVVGALDNLHGNLRTELRDLESARSQLASAQDGKAKADQAVAATQRSIDDLTAQSDGVVVDAFMNPPADTALDAMGAATAGDASSRRRSSACSTTRTRRSSLASMARTRSSMPQGGAGRRRTAGRGGGRQGRPPPSRTWRRPGPRGPASGPGSNCGAAGDFTCGGGTVGRGSACFGWLASHAAGYGLHNLPSEPWHWSADGS
jgi:hypothetical protein